jgi:hypothetical protein
MRCFADQVEGIEEIGCIIVPVSISRVVIGAGLLVD